MKEVKDSDYQASLKSLDTEEGIDLAFYRPIGYMWARLAKRLGIRPNAITIASIFLGVGAGVAFYSTSIWVNIVGMLLLVWANSFDSADGQLARMTGDYSRVGRILDGLSGDLWFVSIYFFICLRVNHTELYFAEHPWLIWIIAIAAGICHGKQAATADYYRQFHLYFLKGKEGSELDTASILKERYTDTPWSKLLPKLTLLFYGNYTASQEAMSPKMQQLRRRLKAMYGDAMPPQAFRDDFRRMSLPLMKYTNILTFNWRSIVLFASVLCGLPWLYFVAEFTVFNIILIYMVWRHERMCATLLNRLNDGYYN
ncbi:MAG: CDP-alcohol phosphatidyltransferase family protein [Muribaculaceae bacterium]|nr:CDP-alcohol phosphatidyltransferase family protein [Muribaculaceae bacterium]